MYTPSGPRRFNKKILITPDPNGVKDITIQAPSAISSGYSIELLDNLPASTSALYITPSGKLSTTGSGGASSFVLNFGDVSQRLIQPAIGLISSVRVQILQAFNAVGATLTVGTLAFPNLLFQSNQIDMSQPTEFENRPSISFSTSTDVYVSYTAGIGGSQGQAYILLEIN